MVVKKETVAKQTANRDMAKKAPPAAKSKISLLSEELIVNSDSESGSDSDDSSSGGDSASEAQDTQQTLSIAQPKTNGSATKRSSLKRQTSTQSEATSTSSVETAEPISTPRKPTSNGQKSNGIKRKGSQEETEVAELSRDSNDKRKSKKARIDSTIEEESSQTAAAAGQPVTASIVTPSKALQHIPLAPIPAKEYVAPQGYRPVEYADTGDLSPAELDGKIIWHIAAPIGVPLSSVTSLATEAVQKGQSVLTHNEIDYVLIEAETTEASVLLPSKDGYKAVPQLVQKSYNLRPAFTIPKIPARAAARNVGSSAAADIATAAVTTIRPQPEGLRMRYKPPGYGTGNPGIIGGDSDEDEQDSNTFQFPRFVGPSTDGDGTRIGDGVAKKKKAKAKKAPNGHDEINEPQTQAGIQSPGAPEADDETRHRDERKAKKASRRKVHV